MKEYCQITSFQSKIYSKHVQEMIVWQKIAVKLHKKIEITLCNISEIHSAGKLYEYGVIQMTRQIGCWPVIRYGIHCL